MEDIAVEYSGDGDTEIVDWGEYVQVEVEGAEVEFGKADETDIAEALGEFGAVENRAGAVVGGVSVRKPVDREAEVGIVFVGDPVVGVGAPIGTPACPGSIGNGAPTAPVVQYRFCALGHADNFEWVVVVWNNCKTSNRI